MRTKCPWLIWVAIKQSPKCVLSSCAALCSRLSSLLTAEVTRTCGTCTPLSSVMFKYSLTLNKKFGFHCPGGGKYERFTFIFQLTTCLISLKKNPVIKSFMVYRCISKYFFCVKQSNSQFFFHFIISTCSHLIFIFLEKILASSRRELKTQHWLIYQDNGSSAVSQCHNDLYAQDLCCIL